MEFVNNEAQPCETSDAFDNIWVAASDGDINRVTELLSTGVSVNEQDETGYSPIHAATSYGHLDLIRILINLGANLNLKDGDGDTPLHVCEIGEVADLLISSGADPSVLNHSNQSIYDVAVGEDNTDMIQYLTLKNLNIVSSPVINENDDSYENAEFFMHEGADEDEDEEDEEGDHELAEGQDATVP